MVEPRVKLFKLLETADNYVKYAWPENRQRAVERARRRYEKARLLAVQEGDTETLGLIDLRLDDLKRLVTLPEESAAPSDAVTTDYRGIQGSALPEHAQDRVPPGQRLTPRWPVLHSGPIPRFDETKWRLSITGEVEATIELTYQELKDLGPVQMRSDFHCVTGWSKLDNVWEGIKTATLLELARPTDKARFVSVGAEYGYTANLPIDVLLEDDAMVAWGHNGADLEPKHGFPLRLVIPKLYAWKSVKWVTGFEMLDRDRRGFWELRGYHNTADPWLEQRYSYQE